MQKTFVSFAEASRINAEKTQKISTDVGVWVTTITEPNGRTYQLPPGSDIRIDGHAGSFELGVILDQNGQPAHDKGIYTQRPSVIIVAWGRDAQGSACIVHLIQERPLTMDLEIEGMTRPMRFAQIPMGFLNDDEILLPAPEGAERAARRELLEETGISTILSVELLAPLTYWPDPSLIRNGAYVVLVEVELPSEASKPAVSAPEDHEHILHIEFPRVHELLERIQRGYTPDGVNYHMGLSLGPLMLFFARRPDLICRP